LQSTELHWGSPWGPIKGVSTEEGTWVPETPIERTLNGPNCEDDLRPKWITPEKENLGALKTLHRDGLGVGLQVGGGGFIWGKREQVGEKPVWGQ